jgi:hypothetical protein
MWWLAACGPAPAPPATPGCERLFARELSPDGLAGDGSDTRVAFSPDGERLAVGAAGGRLTLLDGRDGTLLAEHRLDETLVRALAFSADGAVLWVAEQSPDAFVHALDGRTLAARARYRLADDVESSPPPASDDPWGVYQLPAAYHLVPRVDGVVAVGAHGWDTAGGRRNASRVVALELAGADLRPRAAWPASGAADAVFGATASAGDTLAVAVRRSADGPAPAALPIDGVQRLRLPDLTEEAALRIPPWPGFGSVFVWDALAVRSGGLLVGTGDGRLVAAGSGAPVVVDYAVPSVDAAVPVAASVGFLRADGEDVFTLTSRSWTPGSPDGSAVPGAIHPEERAVAAWRWTSDGVSARWAWHGPYEPSGLALSATEVVVGAGARSDGRGDLFGFLRFPRVGAAPSAVCATEGAVLGAPAVTPDGRVAIVEVPSVQGAVRTGPYRVSVWR